MYRGGAADNDVLDMTNNMEIEQYAKERGECYAGAVNGYVKEEILIAIDKVVSHLAKEVDAIPVLTYGRADWISLDDVLTLLKNLETS